MRLLRERKGLSQTEVARRLGLSVSAPARYEAEDANPRFVNLVQYLEAIESDLLELAQELLSVEDGTGGDAVEGPLSGMAPELQSWLNQGELPPPAELASLEDPIGAKLWRRVEALRLSADEDRRQRDGQYARLGERLRQVEAWKLHEDN